MTKKKEPTETTVKKDVKKATTKKAEKPVAEQLVMQPVTGEAAKAAETKPAKTTAPASVAKPAAEPAKPVEPAAAKPAVAKPAAEPAKPTAPAKAKPAAEKHSLPLVTTIVAKYDVGHGNNMYIRGEGGDLGWETGVPMVNAGSDVWVWTTNAVAEGNIVFKLLINDEAWSAGENMSAPVGETTTLSPAF